MRLKDRVAVLTGGGGDIGTATSNAFAREGATVVVTDSRPEMAERTAKAIVDAGGRAAAYGLDVMDEAAVEQTFASIVQRFGCPDILMNLAGDTLIKRSVDMSVEEFDQVCDRFTNKRLFVRDNQGDLARDGRGNLVKINYDNS